MWKMLQQNKPNDYVIGTGKTFTIKDFVNRAAKKIGFKLEWIGKGINEKGVNTENKKVIVECDKKYFRPLDVNTLLGDASKARRQLKWKPKVNIKELIKDMISEEFSY